MCCGKMALKVQRKQPKTSWKYFQILFVLLVCCLKESEATRPGCNYALGMQSRRIKDSQLSASSKDLGYGSTRGRLNGNRAWCSENKKPWTEYFQIVLDRVRHVSRIGTQGYYSFIWGAHWVKTYAVRYSYDGSSWYWYKDQPLASIKEFDANTDSTSEKHITFRETFVAKYLRIYPIKFETDMCLRVEIYGCPDEKDSCTQTLSQSTGVITSPTYPSLYPRGVDCTWIINLPDTSKHVGLYFKNFDINDGATWRCFGGDYIEALDGPTDISTSIGQYCNGDDELPVVKATGSILRLHFHSESDSNPRKGFEAQFVSFTKGVDDILLKKACPGSRMRLDCSSTAKSIKILHAFYGSVPFSSYCGNSPTNTTCQDTGVFNTITSLCEHYKTCQIDVSSRQFGLSCGAGVVPRLTVHYQCTETVIRTPPPPPPSTTTSAPSTAPHPSITNYPPSPTTDTTTTTTPEQATSIPPTDPGSPPSTVVSITDDNIGRWSSTPTTRGSGGGNKLARMEEDDNVGMLVGIVVAVVLVVLILVVVLLCFLNRRRRQRKGNSVPGVTYTATTVASNQAPPRTGSTGCRTNAYESVNVLYVSADDACGKRDSYEHIYDSPELQEPLPKMTNNPLYHGASGFDDQFDEYESIDPPTDKAPLPPRSLDPSIYDSPTQGMDLKSKSNSISNPNYGKTVIEIPDSKK